MNCSNCGAPLPGAKFVCEHCGTRNDVDLRAIGVQGSEGPHPNRRCPHCDIPLETVNVGAGGGLYIEHCPQCRGTFFDPNELPALLDKSVHNVYEVDNERLQNLCEETTNGAIQNEVRYIPCPECGELMNRKVFGIRSGVIIDHCKAHGVWLDGGELRKLLEWTKAGGRIYDHEVEQERQKQQRREQERRRREQIAAAQAGQLGSTGYWSTNDDMDGVLLAVRFLAKLFARLR